MINMVRDAQEIINVGACNPIGVLNTLKGWLRDDGRFRIELIIKMIEMKKAGGTPALLPELKRLRVMLEAADSIEFVASRYALAQVEYLLGYGIGDYEGLEHDKALLEGAA